MLLRVLFFCVLIAPALWPATALGASLYDATTGQENPIFGGAGGAQGETLVSADEITNNETSGTVMARGNVEIVTPERILRAEEVEYDEPRDIVAARGDVALREEDGSFIFAKETRLTKNLS